MVFAEYPLYRHGIEAKKEILRFLPISLFFFLIYLFKRYDLWHFAMFREQSSINNTIFLSFYTDMEARLHFEGNFSGTLFRLKTTIFVQTLYLWKSRSK